MRKILTFVFALVALVALASCGAKEYKLGMGVQVGLTTKNATAEAAGNAQVDATIAAVVLNADGEIEVCRIDAVQNKIAVSTAGALTVPATFKTKMELGFDYNMSKYGTDNNGDEIVKEWFEQAKLFEEYVVGKTVAEIEALELQEVNNHMISTDEDLLAAGCTIQLTDFIAAVVKACKDEQGVTFTAKEFTLGVAANSYNDASKDATAEAAGAVQVYSDMAAVVVENGVIVATLNDAIQPKFAVTTTGELTGTFTATKRELKFDYHMSDWGKQQDNNGDGIVKEWFEQSAAFSKFVVGLNGSEVAALATQTLDNGYQISSDEDLLTAGCTIQITGIKAVVAKAFTNAR